MSRRITKPFLLLLWLPACTSTGPTVGRHDLVTTTNLVDQPGVTAGEFLELVQRAITSGGDQAVDRMVVLFPDLAVDLADGPPGAASAAARSYDRLFGGGSPEARLSVRRALDQNSTAAQRMDLARSNAGRGAHHAALVLAASTPLSPSTFAEAVLLAGTVPDPRAWDLLMQNRPLGLEWPAQAPCDDTELRTRIVVWRLDRGEANLAVLSAVRAEASAVGATRQQLRLLRARGLMLAGRPGEALIPLQSVEASAPPEMAAQALALTGLLLADRDELAPAIRLFQRALSSAPDWPGRGRAMSDLAVAWLRTGDQEKGLALLREAVHHCETHGDLDGLVRSLRCEAVVQRANGQATAGDECDGRAQDLVRSQGLLTDAWLVR